MRTLHFKRPAGRSSGTRSTTTECPSVQHPRRPTTSAHARSRVSGPVRPARSRARRAFVATSCLVAISSAGLVGCCWTVGNPKIGTVAHVDLLTVTPNPLYCVPPAHEGDVVQFDYTVTWSFNGLTADGSVVDPNYANPEAFSGGLLPPGTARALNSRSGSYTSAVPCHDGASYPITVSATGGDLSAKLLPDGSVEYPNAGTDSKTVTLVVKACKPDAARHCARRAVHH